MCKIIPIVVVLALVGGLTYYFLRRNNMVPEELNIDWPTLEDFHREAPWNASNPDEAQRWANDGKGLSLTILNALDPSWYSYYENAIADWEAGLDGIDPLTLTTEVVAQESDCTPENGFQKVCNGDYGDTGWNGINTITMSGDLTIQSSAARMNEYYLSHGSDALKQYTMCHELGHGFGLPHTDESFWNRDLGNCMDYTMNPAGNMHPDFGNFEFLEALYGNTNGGGSSGNTNSTGGGGGNLGDDGAAAEAQSTSGANRQDAGTGDSDGGGGSSYETPSWLKAAWDTASAEFSGRYRDGSTGTGESESGGTGTGGGWRLLHSRGNIRAHRLEVGGGYSIVVHVLLADADDANRRRSGDRKLLRREG